MFSAFANSFKIPELRSRILFTLGLIFICRLVASVPTPGVDAGELQRVIADIESQVEGGFLGWIDLFSGVACIERSLASTTQLFNPITGTWSNDLISRLGLPHDLFPKVVDSATRLGPMTADLESEIGLSGIEVVASCSHDTAAAVAAVPAEGENWAFLSSGTWSLFGVELAEPLISDEAREANYSNEAGFGGTITGDAAAVPATATQEQANALSGLVVTQTNAADAIHRKSDQLLEVRQTMLEEIEQLRQRLRMVELQATQV